MGGYFYKKLNNSKIIIKSANFPTLFKYNNKNSIALIGVGGNLGDVKRRFNHLLIYLKRDKFIKVIATSIIFKNPPFGFLEQPFFYNTLFLIDTKLTPMKLLRHLQRVEKYFKRKREFKNSPRTLDLDIIFYEKEEVSKAPTLIIPHPHWSKRESVLVPLKYLKGVKCLKRVL